MRSRAFAGLRTRAHAWLGEPDALRYDTQRLADRLPGRCWHLNATCPPIWPPAWPVRADLAL